MGDGRYRLVWTDISRSQKIRNIGGDGRFKRDCHLVYTWLIPWGDDDGRLRGDPLWIIANILPYEEITENDLRKILIALQGAELIQWYEIKGEQFIRVIAWDEHQQIRKDRYKPSAYPPAPIPADNPPQVDNQVTTTCQPSADNPPQVDNLLSSPSPSPSPSCSPGSAPPDPAASFDRFWRAYPRKAGKKKALKAWLKLKPDQVLVDRICAAVEQQRASPQWQKDGGEYIPHPTTWLNEERWNDEVLTDSAHRLRSPTPLTDTDKARECVKTRPYCEGRIEQERWCMVCLKRHEYLKNSTVPMPDELRDKLGMIGGGVGHG